MTPAINTQQTSHFEASKKANTIAKQYAKTSKLDKKKDQLLKRKTKRIVKTALKQKCHECNGNRQGICSNFTTQELNNAISKLDNNKTPGKDNIYNELIINLTDNSKRKILDFVNASWAQGRIPNQ